ncbi:MAG: PorT family protein [Bacteroidales bacterium]|nr:PorT family protein [Bacteroidales bacterium]
MKKLLLVLAVVFFANVARAEGFGFCIGPKVGYQSTKLSLEKAEIKKGFSDHFTIGVFGRITINNFIIQPELLWFKSGKVFNFDIDPSLNVNNGINVDLNPSLTLTQQNLAFPIFLGYQIDGGLLKLRANVGPVMYFLLNQKQTVDSDGNTQSVDFDNLDAKGMTWGAALNIGLDVWMFTLDVNYSFGLSKFFKSDDVNWSVGEYSGSIHLDKTKQNVFTITLGLKFL